MLKVAGSLVMRKVIYMFFDGMTEPSIDSMLDKVDSQYTLVIMAARRARELNEEEATSDRKKLKPVSIALREIEEGKLTYRRS